ncbi:MAG: Superoxide dismutase [Mn], partial [uncultured Phycisphaerae bacterium]
ADRTQAAAVPVRRARAAHRQADDGDPPRPALQGVRRQLQRRAAEGPATRRQAAARGAGQEPRHGARRGEDGRPEQRRRGPQPRPVLGDPRPGRQGRRQADRQPRQGDRRGLRVVRRVQDEVRGRGQDPLRLRLGVAGEEGRQGRGDEHGQPGQPADGRGVPGDRAGRVGARVLPEVPEQAAGLRGRVVERGELAGGRGPVQPGARL